MTCYDMTESKIKEISLEYTCLDLRGWVGWVKEHEPDMWEMFRDCEQSINRLCIAENKELLASQLGAWEEIYRGMLTAYIERNNQKRLDFKPKSEQKEEDLL